MRRRAMIAGCGTALLALAGCATIRPRADRADPSADQVALCQRLSQTAQEAIDHHDNRRAIADLERLVTEAPRSAEAYHRLGRVLQLEGRIAEAEAAYRRSLELDPEYVSPLIDQGELDLQQGRPEAALKRFEAAIEIDPQRADAYVARGRVLEVLGRPDEAIASYFRTLELDPTVAPAVLRIAILQLNRNQPEQALARLDQVLELTPGDAEALHQRGRTHLALDHPRQAVADLRLAAAQLPNRADVMFHLAQALDADHQGRDALMAAEDALRLSPDYAEARELTTRLRR